MRRDAQDDSAVLANAALAVGVAVAALTAASQTRPLGALVSRVFGGDFLHVAAVGLVAAVVPALGLVLSPRRRGRCSLALVLCLAPVALLAHYLAVSDG